MQVSEVRLNLLNSNTAVKAIGSFALDDSFAVRGVRVMEDKHGHNFVAFPSREKQDGKELYATITGAVLEEYKQQVEKQEQKQELKEAKEETPLVEEKAAAPKRGKGR